MMDRRRAGGFLVLMTLLSPACSSAPDPPRAVPSPTPSAIAAPPPPASPASWSSTTVPASTALAQTAIAAPRPAIDRERYPWLAGAQDIAPVDSLEDRFAPPPGF